MTDRPDAIHIHPADQPQHAASLRLGDMAHVRTDKEDLMLTRRHFFTRAVPALALTTAHALAAPPATAATPARGPEDVTSELTRVEPNGTAPGHVANRVYGPDGTMLVEFVTVLPPVTPAPWAEEWPPTANRGGVLVRCKPFPCRSCGAIHPVYTKDCLPILWYGGLDTQSGFRAAHEIVPPAGLHVYAFYCGPGAMGDFRYAVVRTAAFDAFGPPLDSYPPLADDTPGG